MHVHVLLLLGSRVPSTKTCAARERATGGGCDAAVMLGLGDYDSPVADGDSPAAPAAAAEEPAAGGASASQLSIVDYFDGAEEEELGEQGGHGASCDRSRSSEGICLKIRRLWPRASPGPTAPEGGAGGD